MCAVVFVSIWPAPRPMRRAAGLIAAGMGLYLIAIVTFLLRVCGPSFLLTAVLSELRLLPSVHGATAVLTLATGIMTGRPWSAAATI